MNEFPESERCVLCEEEIRHLQKRVAATEGIDRACALFDLGRAADVAKRFDLALASFGACLDLLPPFEFPDLECGALFEESRVLADMGRFEEAIGSVTRAKAINLQEGDLEHLRLCEWREGTYLAALGRTQQARQVIAAARDGYLELDRPAMAALCELDLAKTDLPPKRAQKPKSSRRSTTRRRRRRT